MGRGRGWLGGASVSTGPCGGGWVVLAILLVKTWLRHFSIQPGQASTPSSPQNASTKFSLASTARLVLSPSATGSQWVLVQGYTAHFLLKSSAWIIRGQFTQHRCVDTLVSSSLKTCLADFGTPCLSKTSLGTHSIKLRTKSSVSTSRRVTQCDSYGVTPAPQRTTPRLGRDSFKNMA